MELLDFGTGSEGKGPVGGAIEGRDGRGSELADMVNGVARLFKCYCRLQKVLAPQCLAGLAFVFFQAAYVTVHMSGVALG